MKFMHMADLHLDSPFTGITNKFNTFKNELITSPYKAFERGISIAIKEAVDLVMIVGDLYNTKRQTIYAQNFFMQQMRRLENENIPVIILHGNHDYIHSDKLNIKYPNNVYLFKEQQVDYFDLKTSQNETVRIYGFSYHQQWITKRMINDYPMNPYKTDYTIGMLHGNMAGATEDDRYAPFSIEELQSKHYDYWALGHIHLQQDLATAPIIRYAGTIQGRHRNERGDKGAYIVTLHSDQPAESQFVSLASIVWQEVIIQANEKDTTQDLVDHIESIIKNFREQQIATHQSYLLSISIEHAERLSGNLQEDIERGELLNTISPYDGENGFVIVHRIGLDYALDNQLFKYDDKLRESFNETLSYFQEDKAYISVMKEFMNHNIVKQWLSDLEKDEKLKETITKNASDIIIRQFQLEDQEVDHEN